MNDLWVFGYASLMWRPGFDFVESQRARLGGYHRALCVTSWEHRGTRDNPGLVMGLDYGGSCVGLAFRVAPENRENVIAYLRKRELITNVYKERFGKALLGDGRKVDALVYIADHSHEQYAGRLSVDAAVSRICGAVGDMGPNEEYVLNTADHIETLGIKDTWLSSVAKKVRERQ